MGDINIYMINQHLIRFSTNAHDSMQDGSYIASAGDPHAQKHRKRPQCSRIVGWMMGSALPGFWAALRGREVKRKVLGLSRGSEVRVASFS